MIPPHHRTLCSLALGLALLTTVSVAQEAGRYGHYEIHDTDLLSRGEYAARRARVLGAMSSDAAMVVRAAELRVRSNDVDHEFRQRSNMLYLTGVLEDQSALLLVPRGVRVDDSLVHEILFVAPRNPRVEAYEGYRLGPEAGAAVSGIATTMPYAKLADVVASVLAGIDTLYYDGWLMKAPFEPLTGVSYYWESENTGVLQKISPGLRVRDAGVLLNPMRLVKSPAELALLQRAIDISLEAHRETIRSAAPGMYEYQFEAVMEYTFRRLGAEDPGYPSIVGSGPNTCILHYATNRRRSRPGELVLMDCGAEYHGYSADITRTFPVDGRFTAEQRAIYDLVLAAQEAGIAVCRPGNQFRLTHTVAMKTIAEGLVGLGIIESVDEASRYFNHGTSHYIGLDVHDVGAMEALAPGMVLTVEPGVYIPEGSPCDPRWWNIGVRIEDDILVTDEGPVNLSASLERTADAIEELMAGGKGEVIEAGGGR